MTLFTKELPVLAAIGQPPSEQIVLLRDLAPSVQDLLGESLRALYAQTLREPVPRRFVELLGRIDAREAEEGTR